MPNHRADAQKNTINEELLAEYEGNNEGLEGFEGLKAAVNPKIKTGMLKPYDDDTFGLMQVASKGTEKDFIAFVEKLTPAICEQAALTQNAQGKTMLSIIADKQNSNAFNCFAARLSKQTLTKALLLQGNDNNTALEKISRKFSDKDLLNVLNIARGNSDAVKEITATSTQLKTINFYDSGGSHDTWSNITKNLIAHATAIKPRQKEFALPVAMANTEVPHADEPNYIQQLLLEGWQFLGLQGRTIKLINIDNEILAIKILKVAESVEDLEKEFKATSYLKTHAAELNLKSSVPTPLKITQLENIQAWVKTHVSEEDFDKFQKMVGTQSKRSAYIYKVNNNQSNYFTYLHDSKLSNKEFKEANRVAIHDLFTLLGRGYVFTQLADIFHNLEKVDERKDRGRYMVLVNLLRRFINQKGSGRVTNWPQAVRYPNVRAGMLADWGDGISLKAFLGDTEYVKDLFAECLALHGDKAGNYLIANIMAEYQYVLFLIAGYRGRQLTAQAKLNVDCKEADIKKIWYELATQIVENCAQAVSILTHKSEKETFNNLKSMVDVNRLSRQMQYWMTEEYVPDIEKNKIAENIYGANVLVTVDKNRIRKNTFNSKVGSSIDGKNPDLGFVNGQEPIKEANKLFYEMTTEIFKAYHEVNLSLKDLHGIAKEKDILKSEALRKRSFSHLQPHKSYHAIQRELCEQRLKQKAPLNDDIKKSLESEVKIHKENYAAMVITGFMRKCIKAKKPEITEDAPPRYTP